MTNIKKIQNAWLFNGPSNKLDIAVPPAPPGAGGYLVAFKLSNDCVKIGASKHPSAYITQLRYALRTAGGTVRIEEVYVSPLHLRYEAIKRFVTKNLADAKVSSDLYKVTPSVVTRHLAEALTVTAGMNV